MYKKLTVVLLLEQHTKHCHIYIGNHLLLLYVSLHQSSSVSSHGDTILQKNIYIYECENTSLVNAFQCHKRDYA